METQSKGVRKKKNETGLSVTNRVLCAAVGERSGGPGHRAGALGISWFLSGGLALLHGGGRTLPLAFDPLEAGSGRVLVDPALRAGRHPPGSTSLCPSGCRGSAQSRDSQATRYQAINRKDAFMASLSLGRPGQQQGSVWGHRLWHGKHSPGRNRWYWRTSQVSKTRGVSPGPPYPEPLHRAGSERGQQGPFCPAFSLLTSRRARARRDRRKEGWGVSVGVLVKL